MVLSRRPDGAGEVSWDGGTLGPWAEAIDGSDVVINLAGRSVSCRYTPANLRAMMDSRVDSARVVGEAIAAAARPPRVWLQMSTATVYAHRFDAPNDEATGVIGGAEPGVPDYWALQRRDRQGLGAGAGERRHPAHPQGRPALRDGDEPGPRRGLRRPAAAGPARPRRPGRGRRAVRVLDPRPRLRPRGRVPGRPRTTSPGR